MVSGTRGQIADERIQETWNGHYGSTYVWAKWGNSFKASQPPCTTNGATWDTDFRGVWHMGQSNAVDSTANGNNGTGGGNTNTTGLIGDAQAFYGSNRVLTCTNHNDSLGVTSAVTMEAWIYYDSTSYGHWALFGKLNGTSANTADYALDMYGGSARIHTSNFQWYNTFYVPQRQWLYLAGTYDGNTREVWSNALYRAYDTQSPSSISNRWPSLLIGKSWDAGSWPGAIDEVRISGVVRSSNWLWACYANAASNTAFNAYESLTRTPDMKAPVLLLH